MGSPRICQTDPWPATEVKTGVLQSRVFADSMDNMTDGDAMHIMISGDATCSMVAGDISACAGYTTALKADRCLSIFCPCLCWLHYCLKS